MYGMQIRPTIIKPGRTTPASQGSKYTSISWRPRKYQGAFDGFGVLAGLAGCSSGALRKIDQTKKTSRKMRPTIGTLSGLVTICRKLTSNVPKMKKTAVTPNKP